MTARLIFNILAVCGTAVFTGTLLTIGLTLGPYWKSLPAAEFLDWFSKNIHFIGRWLPVYLATIALGLAGSLWLGWADSHQRYLWGAAIICIAGLLIITVVYNGRMNSQFVAKSIPLEHVPVVLNRWLTFHTVRTLLALAASIVGVVAVSTSATSRITSVPSSPPHSQSAPGK